jgi:hypothetical protein
VKFKNGSPRQLYVLTDQTDGNSVTYTNLSRARWAKKLSEQRGFTVVLATYVLKGA